MTVVDFNWNQLYYFTFIAEEGSLTRAAHRLNLSVSTLSEHLSKLESDLGTNLFIRQSRKLILTPKAKALFRQSKPMFDQAKRYLDAASPAALGDYPVTIGIVSGPARTLGSTFLDQYIKTLSSDRVEILPIHRKDVERQLIEMEVDLVLGHIDFSSETVSSKLLSQSAVQIFSPKHLVRASLASLAMDIPFYASSWDCLPESTLSQAFLEKSIQFKKIISGEDLYTVYQLCLTGKGIGLFSEEYVSALGGDLKPHSENKYFQFRHESLLASWSKACASTAAIQYLSKAITTFDAKKLHFNTLPSFSQVKGKKGITQERARLGAHVSLSRMNS